MVNSEPGSADEGFAVKLQRLFASVRRADGARYTKTEVAEGVGVSRGYLYDLLNGKYEPGYALVVKLAEFFQAELEYFADSERSREVSRQYELLARLGENNVNKLATRASQLPPEKLRGVLEYMDFQAHRDQGDTDE